MEALVFWGAIAALAIGSWVFNSLRKLLREADLYRSLKPRLDDIGGRERELSSRASKLARDREASDRKTKQQLAEVRQIAEEKTKIAEEKTKQQLAEVRQIAEEKSTGFPWLADAYGEYFELQNLKSAQHLETKSHPAVRAAEQVREIGRERRAAERSARTYRYVVEYYESLFPWLAELREEGVDDLLIQLDPNGDQAESIEDRRDPSRHWLIESEYQQLPAVEKFDLALRRYQERQKTKWEIGRDFERYIGYQMELSDFRVSYQGIVEGLADLGRDLVCVQGDDVEIIQCKYWSKEKRIHEKHVFQLYGTLIAYQLDHPETKPTGTLVTLTTLSERARQFATALDIKVQEGVSIDAYPMVKCNVSRRDGGKIYHLPFDQQYDRTLIEPERGETYVWSAAEAESLGFRRAFRWRGQEDE